MNTLDRQAGLVGAGVNESLAGTAGLPVDALQGLMNLVRFAQGQPPIENAIGGSEWIKQSMGKALPPPTPSNAAERVAKTAGNWAAPGGGPAMKKGAQALSGLLSGAVGGGISGSVQEMLPEGTPEWLRQAIGGVAGGAAQQKTHKKLDIFGGAGAEKPNLAARRKAIDMSEAGENAEKILGETGWYRGLDKKWRFEIDDSKAKLAIERKGEVPPGIYTASEILDHPALFDQYPHLKDYKVFVMELPEGVRGSAGAESMTVSSKPVKGLDRLKTVLHELQHRVQALEGFETGGRHDDPRLKDYAARNPLLPKDMELYHLYKRLAGEMESRAVEHRQDLDELSRQYMHPFLSYDIDPRQRVVRSQ